MMQARRGRYLGVTPRGELEMGTELHLYRQSGRSIEEGGECRGHGTGVLVMFAKRVSQLDQHTSSLLVAARRLESAAQQPRGRGSREILGARGRETHTH